VDVEDRISQKKKFYSCLKDILKLYRNQTVSARVDYIFTTDQYLLDVNQRFLNHDDFTDIITFDLSEDKENLQSEIYISLERVIENAHKHKVPFQNELFRVLSHGLLHLCGYNDKTLEEKRQMRRLEQECISLFERAMNK
jgi:rRNA maturation RNase YbeY